MEKQWTPEQAAWRAEVEKAAAECGDDKELAKRVRELLDSKPQGAWLPEDVIKRLWWVVEAAHQSAGPKT